MQIEAIIAKFENRTLCVFFSLSDHISNMIFVNFHICTSLVEKKKFKVQIGNPRDLK